MKHYIYSVHACSGSRWSKGYTEFYMTDEIIPTAKNPVMSVIVVQIGETEEIITSGVESSRPSNEVIVKLCRATYNNDPYGMKEQKGYIFNILKQDIPSFLRDCGFDIDLVLKGTESMDVNDSRYVNWNYQVGKE
jgi:hypothetical protein